MYHNLITPILPKEHPQYEPKKEIPVEEEVEEESQDPPDPLSGLAGNIAEGIVSGFRQAAAGDQPDEEEIQDADFVEVDALPMPEEPEEEEPEVPPPERRERPLPSPEPRRVRVPELPTTPDLSLFDEFDEALEDFGGEM